jgi:hypothetical protein
LNCRLIAGPENELSREQAETMIMWTKQDLLAGKSSPNGQRKSSKTLAQVKHN